MTNLLEIKDLCVAVDEKRCTSFYHPWEIRFETTTICG